MNHYSETIISIHNKSYKLFINVRCLMCIYGTWTKADIPKYQNWRDQGESQYRILYKKWASTRETCLQEFANNTGADQPAHPCSLISAFIIRLLESTICKLPTGEISLF